MRNLVLVVGLVFLFACKSKTEQAISDMKSLRDKMCDCKDKDCVEKVEEEFKEIGKKYRDEKDDPSPETKKQAKEIMGEYRDCRRKVKHGGGGAGEGDGDGEGNSKGAAAAAEAVSKMTGFKDSMCKCADKACADKVTEEMTKWSSEMAKTGATNMKPSPEDAKKMGELSTAMGECLTKAMTAK